MVNNGYDTQSDMIVVLMTVVEYVEYELAKLDKMLDAGTIDKGTYDYALRKMYAGALIANETGRSLHCIGADRAVRMASDK